MMKIRAAAPDEYCNRIGAGLRKNSREDGFLFLSYWKSILA
jgi:hypothetical protein